MQLYAHFKSPYLAPEANTTSINKTWNHGSRYFLHNLVLKSLGILLLIVSFQPTSAQSETAASKEAMATFTRHFNNEAYDSVFTMFSEDMKKALPLDKITQVLGGVTRQLGKIQDHEFITYERAYATYKTQFEKAVFQVNISQDSLSRMNGLFLQTLYRNTSSGISKKHHKDVSPF